MAPPPIFVSPSFGPTRRLGISHDLGACLCARSKSSRTARIEGVVSPLNGSCHIWVRHITIQSITLCALLKSSRTECCWRAHELSAFWWSTRLRSVYTAERSKSSRTAYSRVQTHSRNTCSHIQKSTQTAYSTRYELCTLVMQMHSPALCICVLIFNTYTQNAKSTQFVARQIRSLCLLLNIGTRIHKLGIRRATNCVLFAFKCALEQLISIFKRAHELSVHSHLNALMNMGWLPLVGSFKLYISFAK